MEAEAKLGNEEGERWRERMVGVGTGGKREWWKRGDREGEGE